MTPDPHTRARLAELRNRYRAEGPWPWLRELAVLAGAVGLLVPLVRPSFLAFLDRSPAEYPEGVHQIVLRAGMLAVGWFAIDVYETLLRNPRRDVVASLPVDPALVVRAELVGLAASRAWLVPALAALLAPIATHGAPGAWARAVVALAGCWLLGLTASAVAHLTAIAAAESARLAPLLDLVRGQNPRASAAFLYAPGVILAACAAFIALAASAAASTSLGSLAALLSPAIAGALLALPIPRLARATWFRGSIVLGEIDARYAALVERDEGRRVYLEWAIRFLPAPWRRYALDDLRHGWRTRRGLVTGAWLLGLGALAAGLTDPAGPLRSVVAGVAGALVVCANGVRLAADEPAFLRATLPRRGGAAIAGRAAVLLAWSAPVVGLAAVGALKCGEWAEVAGLGLAAAAIGAALAVAVGTRSAPSLAWYGPLAAVAGGLLVVGFT